MAITSTPADLTTTRAPFVEQAYSRGELFITDPFYHLYSESNHRAWRSLVARMLTDRWPRYANAKFLEGIDKLHIAKHTQVPSLEAINNFLRPLTGFQAKPVSGYVPAFGFFDCLRRREFPTTITIRDPDKLDYLPEPDIFHDISGHVPMHTDPAFAEVLVKFGECAATAAKMAQEIPDLEKQTCQLVSVIKAMARFFWFTIEFGLMNEAGEIKAYGSGLLSSYGELAYCIESEEVQRFPLQIEWVVNQYFEIDHYQPLLFVVDSFDHLFALVDELERWMKEGKLNNVSPGQPAISGVDIRSFLDAS